MIDIEVGDKVKAKKVDAFFGKYISEGDVFFVDSIKDDWVTLHFVDENTTDIFRQYGLTTNVLDKCFEKYEEPKPQNYLENKVSSEHIDWIIDNSKIKEFTMFDKCTVVTCQLPNGFVIVEHSACVDPANYDKNIGYEICMKRIRDKIWELEGYMLHDKVYNAKLTDNVSKYCEDTCCGCSGEFGAINWTF